MVNETTSLFPVFTVQAVFLGRPSKGSGGGMGVVVRGRGCMGEEDKEGGCGEVIRGEREVGGGQKPDGSW